MEKVVALRGVEYNAIGDDPVEDKTIGFVAQEVEEVIPEIVSTSTDGLKGIAYAKLTPILVEAIKAQQEMIEELKAEIDEIKAE